MRRALKGKVAIVTGSASGIGLDLAQALAAEGADILLNGFGDPAEIERLRKSLTATHGVRAAYSNADLSQPVAGELEKFLKDGYEPLNRPRREGKRRLRTAA